MVIQTSKLLRERNFGSFEGKHADVFRESHKEKLVERDSLSDEESWSFQFADDIETDEVLVQRFIAQLVKISTDYRNRTILVVSHGGPIRMFLAKTGYANKRELGTGSFQNAGHVKVLSNGTDFFIKEVSGIKRPQGDE